MATYKIVMKYSFYNNEFSETYYANALSPTVATDFDEVSVGKLLGFRALYCRLKSIESFDVSNIRLTHYRSYDQDSAGQIRAGVDRVDPDVAGLAARTVFRTTGPAKRFVWLRGLPDQQTFRDSATGAPRPTAVFTQAHNAYVEWVKGNGTGRRPGKFRIRNYDRSGIYATALPVTGIVANPLNPAQTDFSCTGPLDPLITNIRFLGRRKGELSGLAGVFTVVARAGNVLTVDYRLRETLAGGFSPKLRVQPVGYTYTEISEGKFVEFSTRDTGGPFAGRRGRRRAELSRQ